jgi:choline dehydrogenase-like flavoprotein
VYTTSDVIIVGSGAAGSTLAQILAERGMRVIVLEAGKKFDIQGNFQQSVDMYDAYKLTQHPVMTQEGIILWRALMAGGSAVVAMSNMIPSMAAVFQRFGLDMADEMEAFLGEIGVAPLAESLLSSGGKAIREAGERLGIPFRMMPKAIDPNKCSGCGRCPFGCAEAARWNPLNALRSAESFGAEIHYETPVAQVLVQDGRTVGVRAVVGKKTVDYQAERVILSAGGIGTPIILQQTGIEEAGKQLFMDVYVTVVGTNPLVNQLLEPGMALVNDQFHESDGFILSPYIPTHPKVAFAEYGPAGMLMKRRHMIGLMAKTKDDLQGSVSANGKISKGLTEADKFRLDKGAETAKKILLEAGAKPSSLLMSKPQGAHPGGTAAIGVVVDEHLETRVKGLYVCDASVFPEAPGLPPIVPIVGLARWLGKRI